MPRPGGSAQAGSGFTGRGEAYQRGRPGYPVALVNRICDRWRLPSGAVLADVGSGTGLLARPFLERGLGVVGIDPNEQMRDVALRELASFSAFASIEGTAEATGLAKRSVQGVICGQAFHWFDFERSGREIERILVEGGEAAVVWNTRQTTGSVFAEEYELFLEEWGVGYEEVRRGWSVRLRMADWFLPGHWERFSESNQQELEEPELLDRFFSCSYAPRPGSERGREAAMHLRRLFRRQVRDGRVFLSYETEAFVGRVRGAKPS